MVLSTSVRGSRYEALRSNTQSLHTSLFLLNDYRPGRVEVSEAKLLYQGSGNAGIASRRTIATLGVCAFIVVLAALLLAPLAASATTLPGTISENMTLTAEGSPYTGSSVTIKAGVTVNAEPGVVVKVSSLTVNGTLKAEGTAEKTVLFTSGADSGAGQWGGIIFNSGSSGVIDHGEVRYAGFSSNTPAIKIEGVSPTITHSTIRNNSY